MSNNTSLYAAYHRHEKYTDHVIRIVIFIKINLLHYFKAILEWWLLEFLSKLLASLMRNYFPERPSGAPLHTLSKLYDVPVGFVTPPPLIWGSVLLYMRSLKDGCCSISDELSCSPIYSIVHNIWQKRRKKELQVICIHPF